MTLTKPQQQALSDLRHVVMMEAVHAEQNNDPGRAHLLWQMVKTADRVFSLKKEKSP